MHVYRSLFPHHVPYLPSRFSKLSHQASCSLQFGTASAAVRAVARVRSAAPENFSVFVLHIYPLKIKVLLAIEDSFQTSVLTTLKTAIFVRKLLFCPLIVKLLNFSKFIQNSLGLDSGSIGINHDQYSKLTKVKIQKLSYNNQS